MSRTARRLGARVGIIDWVMLALAVFSVGLLGYEYVRPVTDAQRMLIFRIDVAVCGVFFAEFLWRWHRNGWSRWFILVNWYEILGMIPVSHPALRAFRLLRIVRVIVLLSRLGMAADRVYGETYTHDLINRARAWFVNLIGGAVTVYVLDEVTDVLGKGTYTRNVARALESHTSDIEAAVRDTVHADPDLGRLRRLPFFDAIVATSTRVTQRMIIEFLENERTDELVADILRENIEQIRASVRERETQRGNQGRAPPVTRAPIWLAAAGLLVVLWWAWPNHTPPPEPATPSTPDAVPATPTSPVRIAPSETRPAVDGFTAETDRQRSTTPAGAAPPAPWPLADALNRSDDLRALADRIRDDAIDNDPQALWTLGRIFDGCELMAVKYGALNDMTEARRRAELAATSMPPKAAGFHRRQFERCAGFVDDPQAMENAKIWQTLAAEAGHPAAVMRSWVDAQVEPVNPPTLAGIAEAVQSRHPDALLLAPLLLQITHAGTGASVDDAIAEAAWSLAVCDLGVDCSADAEITRIQCIWDACRQDDTLAETVRATTDPFVYREAEALAGRLAEAIRDGRLMDSGLVAPKNR